MSGKKQTADLHAMADHERRTRLLLEVSVVKVAIEHPDMEVSMLAERFGKNDGEISNILSKYGVKREKDMISAWLSAWYRYNRYGT